MTRQLDRPCTDRGTAPIEFIFASVVLLIPLVYLVVALAEVQAGSYATHSAAINAARTAARYPDVAQAQSQAVAGLHFEDFGVPEADWEISFSCDGECREPGSVVTATVTAHVPLPMLPAVFGGSTPHITVQASHSDVVAPYRTAWDGGGSGVAGPRAGNDDPGADAAGPGLLEGN